jgi:hemoglobin-like flavoprotein
MNDHTNKTFHDSFTRCNHQDGFFKRFYEIFVNSSDEVKEKFKNTDMEEQVKMLSNSFYAAKLATSDSPVIKENLKKLAALHGHKDRDIRPELYDLWLDCLIQAVREYDPDFTHEIGSAWREKMLPGIQYMKSHYDD